MLLRALRKGNCREERPAPGPKVLCGEVRPQVELDVVVHLPAREIAHLALFGDVTEDACWAGEIQELPHRRRKLAVHELCLHLARMFAPDGDSARSRRLSTRAESQAARPGRASQDRGSHDHAGRSSETLPCVPSEPTPCGSTLPSRCKTTTRLSSSRAIRRGRSCWKKRSVC